MRRCGLRSRAHSAAWRATSRASSKRPPRSRQIAAMTSVSDASMRSGIRRTTSSNRSPVSPASQKPWSASRQPSASSPCESSCVESILSAISIARSAARRAFSSSSPSSTNQRTIDARPISSAPTSNVSRWSASPARPWSIWATAHSRHSGRVNAPG